MKINDRIQNIKTLLKYCPHSTRDVMLYDDILADYFDKFFNNDSRFIHCKCQGKIYAKIELAKHVLTYDKNNNVIDEYPIEISYCYDWDRDGEDWTSYYFDEEIIRNNWMFKDDMYSKDFIKFEEFPDDIWERIQNILYDKATETISKELDSAKSSVVYWEKRKDEFDNKLNLNT